MRIAYLALAALALCTCKSGGSGTQKQKQQAPIEWSTAQARDAAAGYLVRHMDKSGRFDYIRRSKGKAKKYNLLRHAGALYSLLQYNDSQASPEVEEAILRGSAYLKSRYIRAPQGHSDLLATFSRAEEEGVVVGTAKLGGAGLALIALCGSYDIAPDNASLKDLQALGRFILFMQKEDGSFHSKFIESTGYDTEFNSLYYPGEAMLALTKLYEIDKDPRWLAAALRTAEQLVTSRKDVARPPADHWMMLAGSPLLNLHENVAEPAIEQEPLREHLSMLGRMMVADQEKTSNTAAPNEMGSFNKDARSTPTATRLEGLVSLLQIQRSVAEVSPGLPKSIRRGLEFLKRCQVKEDGAEHGGMPRSCAHDAGQGKRDREIRIDYVQHYLSALLGAEELGLL